MVAPMSETMPSSMAGSRASCCALLKRWISSMNRTVRAAPRVRASRAPWMAARTSAVPELTAESWTRRAPVWPAMSRASVVLPHPGGPKKIMLKSSPPSTAARSTVPGPTMCSWPANSARVRGRMRAASGASAATCSSLREKRSTSGVYRRGGAARSRTFLLPSTTMRKVLVLNTTYEPLNVCSVRRALVLLLKEKAEVLEQSGRGLPQRAHLPRPPLRHPPARLREHPPPPLERPHLAQGRVRARPSPLPVLRQRSAPHRGPRGAALQGRPRHLGQPRHVVRPVQPQEGRQARPRGRPAPGAQAAPAGAGRLRAPCTWTTSTRPGGRT